MRKSVARIGRWIGKHRVFKLFGLYPPWLGTGIRIREVAPDLRTFVVEMPLRPWNRNYVGTQFGGSLYSMCDPFFMLIVMEGLGPGYIVWDKAGSIRFVKPGRGTVRARFHVPDERLEQIRREADERGKTEAVFSVAVVDDAGQTVATVDKTIHVRRK